MEEQGEISEVWCNLPAEIQIQVAEDHLPFSSLCRFRSVSRSWSKPRMRPGSLSGLYIRKTWDANSTRISLFKGKRRLSLLKLRSKEWGRTTYCLSCINGILCCVKGDETQVKFKLCNVFRGHGGTWTCLPHPPPAPKRRIIFAGMSKLPAASQTPPPRTGVDANLDDYLFMAAMESEYPEGLYRPINLELQVYSRGTWSCSVFHFPDEECLMFGSCALLNRCGVLRGSLFYFFMMRLDRSSARLCCIDLLTSDRRCKTVCQLSPGVITEWDEGSFQHPKLAVCSGKVVMVYQVAVQGGKEHEYTVKVDVLDDEKGTWRGASRLPEELRRGVSFSPEVINCGGDELVVVNLRTYYALSYNLATGAWSPLSDIRNRATPVLQNGATAIIDNATAILPMSLSY